MDKNMEKVKKEKKHKNKDINRFLLDCKKSTENVQNFVALLSCVFLIVSIFVQSISVFIVSITLILIQFILTPVTQVLVSIFNSKNVKKYHIYSIKMSVLIFFLQILMLSLTILMHYLNIFVAEMIFVSFLLIVTLLGVIFRYTLKASNKNTKDIKRISTVDNDYSLIPNIAIGISVLFSLGLFLYSIFMYTLPLFITAIVLVVFTSILKIVINAKINDKLLV